MIPSLCAGLLALLPSVSGSVSVRGADPEPDLVVIDGKEIECRVLYADEAQVVYRAKRKTTRVDRASVSKLQSLETSLAEFLAAYDALEVRDVGALADLALFCEGRELPGEARNLWIRILGLDPVNEQAWTKLGGTKGRKGWRLKVRGRFYTLDQLRERVSDWKNAMELPTAHFLIRTDIDPEKALGVALDVERAYLTYYGLLGPLLELHVFDEVPEIHIVSHADDYPKPPTPSQAWFHPLDNTLYVDASQDEARPAEIVEHLTYALLHNSFHRTLGQSGGLPPWASRGLAEAFGLAVRTGVPGEASWDFEAPDLATFRVHASAAGNGGLDRLLAAGRAAFESGSDHELLAAQAYTLTRFLVHGADGRYRDGYGAYLKSAFGGQGAATHLERALGVDLAALEAEWIAYVRSIAG